ncbi:hypothetical protein [Neptuniibacter sp. QD37_11]|uniref:hypothetical protein n=1 Tax=Neptuniibacter sp. QD37_11 TaxID=3398209 RepID=UPI0039F48D93
MTDTNKNANTDDAISLLSEESQKHAERLSNLKLEIADLNASLYSDVARQVLRLVREGEYSKAESIIKILPKGSARKQLKRLYSQIKSAAQNIKTNRLITQR